MREQGLMRKLRDNFCSADNIKKLCSIAAAVCPVIVLIMMFTGSFLLALPIYLILILVVTIIITPILNLINGSRRPNWTPRELMAGTIDQIQFLKRQKRFDQALALVNNLLQNDPTFPEALYLKAEILLHGFDNIYLVRQCLYKVLENTKPECDQPYHWAQRLLRQLNDTEKNIIRDKVAASASSCTTES